MEAFWKDVRYGVRVLLRSPGFTLIAIATLALGIGANTALFSMVNGVLLEPLRFPQANQLVTLYENRLQFEFGSISYPNFLDWKRDNRTFQSIAAFRPDDFSLTGLGEPERVNGVMVSADFFPTLGVNPALGGGLDPEQDRPGGTPEVMISAEMWKKKFGAAPDVVGKTMTLNGTAYTIVGVVPASFHLYIQNFRTSEIYVPVGQWNDVIFHDRNVGMGMDAVARLKPGVTMEQAREDMERVTRSLAATYPEADTAVGATVISLKEKITGEVRPYLLMLLAAVFFVLLIACVNVANLLLARSMGRSREFAIRSALGATKLRVIRQLLTESVLLALCGGGLGLLFASWGMQGALGFLPESLPRAEEIGLDTRVLVFTFAIAVLSGIVFGLAPALKALKPNLQETLKEGGRGASSARSPAQSVFVVVEMATALVLLVGAGLMLRTLGRLWSIDPGFRPKNVLFFQVAPPPSMASESPDAIRANLRQLHDEIAGVPGIAAASMQRGGLPMYGDSEDPFWIAGQPKPARESEMPWALWYEVEPDYLKVMGIPLKRGRFFTEQDNERSPLVVVIDESLAEKYFPHEDPIGQSIIDEFVDRPASIVGVVGHVKHWGLDDKKDLHAEFYIPFMQIPDKFMSRAAGSTGVLVRSESAPPLALLEPIRKKIGEMNSQEVVFEPHTYDELISRSLADKRFSMVLLGVFAALALVLSSIGIYGVISYVVGQRTHEVGIRIALGAQQKDVLMMVLGEGTRTALIGVAVGLAAALGLTRLMASVLYGVSATDPVTFVAVTMVLTGVALAACYIPARRAMRVDPIVALRYE
ncbi:MAG: ABC transporter permease [Candidatus Acidiferrales bacterium]